MKIATYNIHSCVGTDGCFSPSRTARVLQELDAGIIALQEVENLSAENLGLLEGLAAATGLEAITGPTIALETRHYGNAILTSLPILDVRRLDLSVPRHEPRAALDVLLQWRDAPLQVITTHLGLRPAERRAQVARMLSAIDIRCEHVLLLGDINEWLMWGRPLRLIRRHFGATPHRRTFPARFPVFALDRIWMRPRSRVHRIEVHGSPLARRASDHLPLTAELR
jgi:endonuclease/exonuclease/phosphatase family metal-dependent hydrolase